MQDAYKDPRRAASVAQRVWKVSKSLDRLTLLCEQHQKQTRHVAGMPDWQVPRSLPAGVKCQREEETPPTYFAWQEEEDDGEKKREGDRLVERSRALRASARQYMAQLGNGGGRQQSSAEGVLQQEDARIMSRKENQEALLWQEQKVGRQNDQMRFPDVEEKPENELHKQPEAVEGQIGILDQRRERRSSRRTNDGPKIYGVYDPVTRIENNRVMPSRDEEVSSFPQSTYRQNYRWWKWEDLKAMEPPMHRRGVPRKDPHREYCPVYTPDEALVIAKKATTLDLSADRNVAELSKDITQDETRNSSILSRTEEVEDPTESVSLPDARHAHPRTSTREAAVMTEPPPLVDESTQTDPWPKPRARPPTRTETEPLETLCSRCGRHVSASGDEKSSQSNSRPWRTPPARTSRRTAPTTFNPILMNTRYPAEPSAFRGKSTYEREYGEKRNARR